MSSVISAEFAFANDQRPKTEDWRPTTEDWRRTTGDRRLNLLLSSQALSRHFANRKW
jgi:hypothetical protein